VSDGYPERPVERDGQPEAAEPERPVQSDEPAEADPRVGAAVRHLDELADRPLAEHVEVFESVHRSLQESLAEAAGDGDPGQQDPRAGEPRSDR
jgi:hypothetical protein